MTVCPFLRRACAALSPVMPAPRMAMFLAIVGDGFHEGCHVFWLGCGEDAVA